MLPKYERHRMQSDFVDTSFRGEGPWASQTLDRLDEIFDEFAAATPNREKFVESVTYAYKCSNDLDEQAKVRKLVGVPDHASVAEVEVAMGLRWDWINSSQMPN